jgi:hypothetical protein
MNDNTILRIKVPANLYESVKKQLTLNEAKKAGHNYGAGMEVVKEKKMKTPKDGMKKVKEGLRDGMYNDFAKWKESFPEDTEFKQENGYMMAKDKSGKELGKWNPSSMLGSHADDFQYKSLEEMPAKKDRSLDELMKAKKSLEKKINEMEMASKDTVEEAVSPEIMDAIGQIVDFAKDNAGFLAGIGGITGIAKMIADKIKQDPEARKSLDKKTGAGSTDTSFFEEKKKDVEDK